MEALHAAGLSFRAIAAEMNAAGIRTKTGALWTHRQVARILEAA